MIRPLRMLYGAISGALISLAIGSGVMGILLPILLLTAHPMDRWHTAGCVYALIAISSTMLGMIAGLASKASEHGLSLLKSMAVVAVAAIIATVLGVALAGGEFILLAAFFGVLVGGLVVAVAGVRMTGRIRTFQQVDPNQLGDA